MAKLLRSDLMEIIKNGGSVLLNGQHYSKANLHEFPTEADLAAGDEAEELKVRNLLNLERKRIEDELAKLESAANKSQENKVDVKAKKVTEPEKPKQ